MNGKIATDTVKDLALDKIQDNIRDHALGEAASKTAKTIAGTAALFVAFVDTYSKAVKAENLDNVKRTLGCAHIGGCANMIHAQQMACDTTATVFQMHDGYWYFHPQVNYNPIGAWQIYRTTKDGSSWRIEKIGRSEWALQKCLACHMLNEDV